MISFVISLKLKILCVESQLRVKLVFPFLALPNVKNDQPGFLNSNAAFLSTFRKILNVVIERNVEKL